MQNCVSANHQQIDVLPSCRCRSSQDEAPSRQSVGEEVVVASPAVAFSRWMSPSLLNKAAMVGLDPKFMFDISALCFGRIFLLKLGVCVSTHTPVFTSSRCISERSLLRLLSN